MAAYEEVRMCRWLAYSGSPVCLEDLLFKPKNSLVVQSKHSQLGVETTNGDGFGVGWYGEPRRRGCSPAPNRPGTTATCESSLHRRRRAGSSPTSAPRPVRRSSRPTAIRSGTAAGCGCTTACVADFPKVKRDLAFAVDPDLFPQIEGSTDSELFFYLALTFGLEEDPPEAVAQAVGVIEEAGRRHGVDFPIQMTVATTDGETTWAFRYSSEGRSRSLFHSTDVATLRSSTPTTRCFTSSPTMPVWWSPSLSATCTARGGKCRRRAVWW